VPPGVLTQGRTYLGTPLSGPLADDAAQPNRAAGNPPSVAVWFFVLEKMPGESYEPLEAHVRLIVATRENSPVLPSGRLTAGVRLIDVDGAGGFLAEVNAGKFGPAALVWTARSPLLPGATVDFSVSEPDRLAARRIGVDVYRTQADALGAAILMDGFVSAAPTGEMDETFTRTQPKPAAARRAGAAPPPPPPPPAQPAKSPEFQSEIAIFDVNRAPSAFALLAPMRFGNSRTEAVLALVQVSAQSADPAYQQLVAQAQAEIQNSSQAAARQARSIGVDPADWPGLSSAVESLAFANRQRAGLLFLSQQTGAQITQDVALAANDAVLSQLAAAAAKAIADAPAVVDRPSIGWILERATLRMMMEFQSGGKLPPELAAILARRAGQAGRNSGTLEEVLSNAFSLQDLQNRLAAENYIFLEDSSPAARVRAFDWLAARHLAPPGYDPLAPSKQRRDALEQAEQTSSAAGNPPASAR
jgi:hypothetical protein